MKNKKKISIILLMIIIVIVAIVFMKNNLFQGIKKETITAENYDDIMKQVEEEFKEKDEAYYFTYACTNYILKDGLSNLLSDDQDAMYANIYNKTVGQLMDEGKQLMKENDMTVKKFKESLEDLGGNKTSEKSATETVKDKLTTISNDFVTELWNEVFCNISWYVKQGTNSVGEHLDIEYTINKADNLMKQRDEYNDYIFSLEGDEYSQIKYIWERLIGEIDRMYARIKEETPREKDNTYKFDAGNFSEYSNDFKDEIDKLK